MSQSPTVIFNAAATINASVTVGVEQVDLLSVIGRLDDSGLELLQSRLDELLAGGTRLMVADLSGAAGCDGRLLTCWPERSAASGAGWLRLVGLGAPVLDALDQAALPEVLLVYRAAQWAGHGVG